MALAKVTLQTALPAVRQLATDLRRSVREIGPMPVMDSVLQGLDGLDAYCAARTADVEVTLVAPFPPDLAEKVAGWLAGGFPKDGLAALPPDPVKVEIPGGAVPVVFQVRAARTRVALRAGTPRPPVLVVLAPPGSAVGEEERLSLERQMEDRPHVVVLAAPAEPSHKELVQRAKAVAWTCDAFDLARLPEAGLQARLAAAPWDGVMEPLRAHSAAGALDTLAAVMTMSLEQQAKEVKVKKSMAQQRLGKLQQVKATTGAPAELLAEVKARCQRNFAEFERGAGERLQDLLGQPNGTLTRELEAKLLTFTELEYEEKVAHLVTRVPAAFEEQLNAYLRERVASHFASDLVAVNDLFRMLAQDIERVVAQAGGPPLVVHFDYLTEDRIRRILDTHAYVQSAYRGELDRQSFGDYFADVRKYSMLLVMGASMFGVSSYLRMYREFVIPLTIILVLFGVFHVATSTKQQRLENQERELELARQSLRPELKRALTELQKMWSATLSQVLAEQLAAVLADVDAGLRDGAARRGGDGNPEKDRLMRQVQTLDAAEKRLLATGKAREATVAAIPQIRGDLRPLVVSAITGPARPAAGASPAAAVAALRAGLTPRPAAPATAPAGPTAPAAAPAADPAAPPRDLSGMKAKLAALRAKRSE